MYINLTEAGEQRQRAIVEEVIKRASPGVKLRWGQKGSTETHVLLVKIHGRRYRLEISQDALDATEDPADLHRLELEILTQLRVSESGKAVGYVRAPL